MYLCTITFDFFLTKVPLYKYYYTKKKGKRIKKHKEASESSICGSLWSGDWGGSSIWDLDVRGSKSLRKYLYKHVHLHIIHGVRRNSSWIWFYIKTKICGWFKSAFLWSRLSVYKHSKVQICILWQSLLATQTKHKNKWTENSGFWKWPSYLKEFEEKSKVCWARVKTSHR